MITLETAKSYLGIDSSFTADDDIIEVFIESAQDDIKQFLNKVYPDDGDTPGPVKTCALMLVAYYYQNRTGVKSDDVEGLNSVKYRDKQKILEDIIDYRRSAWLTT